MESKLEYTKHLAVFLRSNHLFSGHDLEQRFSSIHYDISKHDPHMITYQPHATHSWHMPYFRHHI